jgi:hypothetical protein
MPDPFWLDLEAAYNVVAANNDLQVEVKRGDKQAIVKYLPQVDGGVMFVKIMPVSDQSSSELVELNAAARKEV